MMKSVLKDVDGFDMKVDRCHSVENLVKDVVELPVRDATWGWIAWFLREDLRWGNRRKFDRE